MDSYSKAAMERAMKVQEVLLRAMAEKVTWFQAAEILGVEKYNLLDAVHGRGNHSQHLEGEALIE